MAIEELGLDRQGRERFKVTYRVARREKSKTFYSRREAERFQRQVRAQRTLGQLVDPTGGRRRFGDWAREFEEGRFIGLDKPTRLRDSSLLNNHVLPSFGDLNLASLHRTQVQRWVNGLVEKGLAPDTVRRVYEIFQRIAEGAVTSDLIPRSPCRDITLPKNRRGKPQALGLEELWRITQVTQPRYQALIPTGAWGGLRPGELAGLRVRDIDFLRGTLSVVQGVREVRGWVEFTDLKNEAADATISLPPFLLEMLSVHIRDFVIGRGAFDGFPPENTDGLLFVAGTWKKPTVLRVNNFRARVWKPALRAAGLPPYPPKVLRASHATLLAQLATHPVAIQGRLRHSDPRTAQEYYTQFNAPMDAQVTDALEAAYRAFVQRRGLNAASDS
jgi:integrase